MESPLRALDSPSDRIRQHRQASDAPFILVEGPGDALVLEQHLPTDVTIFPVDGKRNVAIVGARLLEWGLDRFIGITDNDFDDDDHLRFAHLPCHHPYYGRDLEAMLIELGVLEKVLTHLGSGPKLAKLGGAKALVALLQERVSPISVLKQHNQRHRWGLSFTDVNVIDKIDKGTLQLHLEGFCNSVFTKSSKDIEVTVGDLLAVTTAENTERIESSGKDVVVFAGVALRRQAGNLSLAATTPEILAGTLRGSCDFILSRSVWMMELLDAVARMR